MPFNTLKAHQIHSHKYDYSKVVYVDSATKVEIICPVHGTFWQSPKIHIYGKGGCKQCANDRVRGAFAADKAASVHSGRYDYSNVKYVNADTKVEIICPSHGSFWQTPDKHINVGTGCPGCKSALLSSDRRLTIPGFVERATQVHGTLYDYSKVAFTNMHDRVEILCPRHGSFWQTPTNHVDGANGCPSCSTNVSRSGDLWISSFNIPSIMREHVICIDGKRYKVDGYDPATNTVYEYFGVFWHGCPSYTDHSKINPRNNIPYQVLYEKTLERIEVFKRAGFNLVYQWGK